MSCVCPTGEGSLGARLSDEQTARKPGFKCAVCGHLVEPGERCRDFAGIGYDASYGFFYRMHADCFRLMELYSDRFCGGEWAVPWPLEVAVATVVAHGHEEWAREWLLLYEQTWRFYPDIEEES